MTRATCDASPGSPITLALRLDVVSRTVKAEELRFGDPDAVVTATVSVTFGAALRSAPLTTTESAAPARVGKSAAVKRAAAAASGKSDPFLEIIDPDSWFALRVQRLSRGPQPLGRAVCLGSEAATRC
ncbi:unannotated protein [freshwater metagenome]|uniref:Unannotated protein n=1 Tax=freshwater metagenome TaxID=449393 RepID=A0A6J6KKB6_9ZZZZ